MRRGRGAGWALAGIVLCVGAASAQLAGRVGDVIEPLGTNVNVDWTQGVITATGLGAPPPNAVNPAQARAMAKRAAYIVATRNLLEMIKGVRVDSATLVENFIVTSDVIKTRVEGFVRGAQVLREQVNPDGSVEVLVGVRLNGDLANTLLPRETGGGAPLPVVPDQAPSGPVYTGLIVDARGTGVRPAMAPKIRNEDGREVYGAGFVGRQYAVEQGMVGYLKDVMAAQGNPRVTNRPLLVKAVKADGPNRTDLVIKNSDAQILHGTKEHLGFLEKARVVVVVD
ncbi:LPP20 family lipoprotein [Nitrospira sp. Kam-Ns4a]